MCCSDVRVCALTLSGAEGTLPPHLSSCTPLSQGVASDAAEESEVEESYCKAKLIAMARLLLTLMPEISKVIC